MTGNCVVGFSVVNQPLLRGSMRTEFCYQRTQSYFDLKRRPREFHLFFNIGFVKKLFDPQFEILLVLVQNEFIRELEDEWFVILKLTVIYRRGRALFLDGNQFQL